MPLPESSRDWLAHKSEISQSIKVYDGKWKGIHVRGGEFGHALCVEMGVRYYVDLLEIVPEIDTENKIISIPHDELKRSTDEVVYSDFLLPQWQNEALAEDNEE